MRASPSWAPRRRGGSLRQLCWLYAVDADDGEWRWRAKSNYPVQSGVTPTAGGVVLFGDMGGNFYALAANTGARLWGQKIDGVISGGVMSGPRRGGASSPATEKMSILGLPTN